MVCVENTPTNKKTSFSFSLFLKYFYYQSFSHSSFLTPHLFDFIFLFFYLFIIFFFIILLHRGVIISKKKKTNRSGKPKRTKIKNGSLLLIAHNKTSRGGFVKIIFIFKHFHNNFKNVIAHSILNPPLI